MAKLTLKLNPSSHKARIVSWWQNFGAWADSQIVRTKAAWPHFAHQLWLSGSSTTLLAAVVLGAAFLKPDNIDYTLAHQENCVNTPVFLPELVSTGHNENYELQLSGQHDLFGYPIFSDQVCVRLKNVEMPGFHEIKLSHPLLPFADKTIQIGEPESVLVSLGRPDNLPVATSGRLVFHLSTPDNTFNYRLSANKSGAVCAKQDAALLCSLDRLNLKQDGIYQFKLTRLLDGQDAGVVFEQELKTVEPIDVVKSSIKSKQTIQNIPTKITLTTNKAVSELSELKLFLLEGKEKKELEAQSSYDGKRITVELAKPLKRRAQFELSIKDLLANDGGYLLRPYSLRFSTSGGPRISAASIGTYGVGLNQSIVLSLDSQFKSGQNLKNFVSVSGGLNYSVSGSGKLITISPVGNWPRCAKFSITYKDGLKNRYGVSGGSSWQFSSRTLCQQISFVGNSVEGRGIYAYRFGNGANKVIFVGGTHGDESSSVHTLTSWIDQLEANYDSIPSNKTVIVVPNINPDGYACGCRVNANNIDLNRNFPANNWKKDVIMPGGSLNKGGGGKSPLDQPESSAIASYVLNQNPDLVLTYHAIGSLAIANESGNSRSLAGVYGSHTGYWAMGNSEIDGVFSHDTTGAFEDWLHDKHGIPAILIELSGYGGNEFWHHQSAMWAMVKS